MNIVEEAGDYEDIIYFRTRSITASRIAASATHREIAGPRSATAADRKGRRASRRLDVTARICRLPVLEGTIRLIRIGSLSETIDLQPCGGTHISNTSEIGHIRLGKV
ncbi:hypothetical protein [Nguyenibacter sp. L1]|uniref:hypothetical protein n=1 Tax=Nguyenibacter sp. L1 TaxID=3049350 RepID=UPI002B4A7CB7|nr:hypothetical protein [Nguyenibacter sp. L1]WRH89355.1 hypothetical protein QN315_07065 [Nguyenibacter sp. L1]